MFKTSQDCSQTFGSEIYSILFKNTFTNIRKNISISFEKVFE